MSRSLVRRGVRDHVQVISSMGQTFDDSRPLMDLSPLVALLDAVNGLSRTDRTVQEVKESIHIYYKRLLKALKEYSGKEVIEPKDMLHFVFSFWKAVETNSDDEEEQTPETENENINEEYPLIEFFPMFTVNELHADLQGTVQENVWDLTGKEVGLIKGVEPIKITLKPNVVYP
ncbi:hypothetical protein NDU88_000735 [Pleurodeles waltl]|uniref:Uncharacterized protein n=1 Tax=Pleurodeles waltl TaxID=8319 RepID=A0AAV7UQT7_PLEWA|nr:hypothetical protein NDU88_000735 [Pleurodeles waltl]